MKIPAPFFLLTLSSVSAEEPWSLRDPLPTPRQEVGVAALEGLIYVLGGLDAARKTSSLVERYDPALDRWDRASDLPRALHHAGAAALGGRLYSIGGLDPSFAGVVSCFAYDPLENRWQEVAPLPRRRGAAGIAVLAGKIYATGGQDGSTSLADFAAYTPDEGGGSWETLSPLPAPRNHLAAAAACGALFALSGRSERGLLPEVYRFDPALRAWNAVNPIPTPRGGIAAAALGTGIFVFGGEGNPGDPKGIFPVTERYDCKTDSWEARLDMLVPRHGIGAAAVGDFIFIPGGSTVEGFGTSGANAGYSPGPADLPPFRRGDVNRDGALDLADPVRLLLYLFASAQAFPCADAGDFDDDGALAIADAVGLLSYLFLQGPPPPAPTLPEGGDPSGDLLECG
ncbi:MAG: galactose oxidase [Planctomycetes bacterium]|nr:galactose oxidase [Planctomycetota bacterium]